MVDATVSSAIVKLGEFIAHEVNIRIGVRDGVRLLKNELGYLQASVRCAESRQEEELIRNWVNELKDVASDAVTVLRDFNALQQEHAAPKHGILNRFRDCVCIFKKEVMHYDIVKEIESLKERIDGLKQRRTEYGINILLTTPNVQQKQRTLLRTTTIDNQVDVVGFEDDIKTLKAELDSENISLKVISIHGMGGLGKTSLATKLYNSSELRQFDTHAKVCVSKEHNIKDVLKRIVKSFMGPEHEQNLSNMDEHDLLQYLSKLLQDRGRYLVLIDDIWDIKVWDQIKIAFKDQKNGSRIIITTRNKKIAETVDDKCFVHQLCFLTEEESWQLFCKRVDPTTPNLKKLGREMVGKCRGLPLAIVVLSGLLLHNRSYDHWSRVKENIWRKLREGGSFRIEEILSLSYDELSSQMRDCFLYQSRYPEGHVIDPDELKRLWIAEGFISEAEEGDGVVMEGDFVNNHQTKLHTLGTIQCKEWIKMDTVNMTNLHTLFIDDNKEEEEKEIEEEVEIDMLESIASVPSLQTLCLLFYSSVIPTMKPLLSCNRLKSVYLMGTLKDPSELCFLPDSVTDLTLVNSEFLEDPMPTLGNLSNLTGLELYNVYRGNKMVCSHNAFPSLQILRLKWLSSLEELEVEDGAFPCLQQYQTQGCEKLEKIPIQLKRIWVPYRS